MRRRWTGSVPFQPTITQKVKQALYDSGHEDLVDGILESGLKEIEETVDGLKKRIIMLEQAEAKRVTETGVNRLIDAKVGKAATDWSKWGTRLALAAAIAALGKWIVK